MEEVREVGKLKLDHDVLMGAKNSLGDKYLLVYLPTKKRIFNGFLQQRLRFSLHGSLPELGRSCSGRFAEKS